MKKTLIVLFLSVLITIVSSCGNNAAVTDTDTQTDTKTKAPVTNAQTLAELVTAYITEQDTVNTEKGETYTIEVTETEIIADTTAEETEKEKPENNAYLIYKNAAEKTNSLSNAREITQIEQRIKISFPDGQHISSSSSESSDIVFNGDKYKGKVTKRAESDGQTYTTEREFHADNDKIYLKNSDGGYTAYDKTDPGVSDVNALLSEESLRIPVLPESVFTDAEVKDNGDGTKVIKTRPSDEKNNDALKNTSSLKSIFDMLGADNVEYRAKDAEYTFTVSKDGYIVRSTAKMNVEMTMTVAGTAVKAISEAVVVGEMIDPGQSIEL